MLTMTSSYTIQRFIVHIAVNITQWLQVVQRLISYPLGWNAISLSTVKNAVKNASIE